VFQVTPITSFPRGVSGYSERRLEADDRNERERGTIVI
jgi:hypothetical protein